MGYIKTLPLPPPRCRSVPHQLPPASAVCSGLNQHIFKVNPKSYFPKEYVYEQLSSYIVNFVKMAEARKTTMGHITTDHLEQSKIPLPPESLIKQFKEKIYPIHLKIGQTKQENRELTKLRDWLLPMLMNGQARVE